MRPSVTCVPNPAPMFRHRPRPPYTTIHTHRIDHHTYTLIHFMHYMPRTLHTHHTHITLQQHHNSTHSYTHTAHCTPNNTQRAIIFLPICQFFDSLPILANLPIFTQPKILLATCNLHLPSPASCFTSLNILQASIFYSPNILQILNIY